MKTTLRGWLPIVLVLLAASAAWADVKLPKIFSDQMVLQQQSQAPVWGWAAPGEKVTVSFGDAQAEATASDQGRWSVKIATGPASKEPRELKIKGNNEVTYQNVLVGEVWVCSGQSNMQWGVAASANKDEEIKNANYPLIRLFTVPSGKEMPAPEPQDDFPLDLKWVECSPQSVPGFSAVGYFFGRKLHQELDVPVGLINSSWGGTIAEAWTSKPTLESDPEWFGPILERHREFKEGNPNQASVLFNGMLKPLIPYSIRGAIWYQGESNVGRAEQYAQLFPAMIRDWRQAWGQGEFPFLFVQLAPYCYGGDRNTNTPKDTGQLAELWEAQTKTLALPNTGMAVTTDITELFDIHPKNKQDVGARLARWALAKSYDRQSVEPYSGPLYKSMKVEDGKIRISFQQGQGLKSSDGQPLTFFEIAGDDQQFVPAQAEIDGESVVVRSAEVSNPVAVRFGWKDYATPNLVNAAGLPASPFRTDDWKMVTAGKK